jgi:Ca-activated chloride channel family protein
MFDFAYPLHLYLLGLVIVFGLLYWWARASRTRKLKRFGRPEVLAALMPDASRYKPAIKITLQLIALAALVIVLARPRAGQKQQESTISGIEVMIAFDVSNSMLASSNDDPNGISRLSRARLLLEKMIDKLGNDKVGLIVFAGDAKTQLPLTTDFYSAKMYLNDLTPSMISFQGTDIAQAMKMAMNGFSTSEDVHKSIILITDAEDHEGAAIDAAKEASDNGIQVNVIGLGSAKGAPIPLGTRRGEYLRDAEGQVVTTAINEQLAKQIAEAGGGIYLNGGNTSALSDLMAQLETLQKSEFKRVTYNAGAEQFPTFAWFAFILLLIDTFILDRKIGWLKNVNFFSK